VPCPSCEPEATTDTRFRAGLSGFERCGEAALPGEGVRPRVTGAAGGAAWEALACGPPATQFLLCSVKLRHSPLLKRRHTIFSHCCRRVSISWQHTNV